MRLQGGVSVVLHTPMDFGRLANDGHCGGVGVAVGCGVDVSVGRGVLVGRYVRVAAGRGVGVAAGTG